ncbi:MAG: fasciclin domain-containing protein [Parvibaculum sp.]|uniref:fasciclin domain-containing protein n=1 Tax=Parvibaculum sp. TaxID=2024848 RepID=UPI0025E4E538|nr:fasciclin domain-containing protein [Parvibaculum sp.]MCE9648844.1 fasciclin domain-containing protein [Parvibaculum sp.]
MMKFKTLLAAAALVAMTGAPAFAAGNLYDTLKADPQFSTLVKVIDATGTKHNYTSGTRTVFAPTNEAFDKIKGGYDDMLGGADKENTRALLLYQIIPGSHTPASLKGKTITVNTLQKDPVTIDGTGDMLHYGGDFGANQSGEAITASNGVIVPVDRLPTPVFSQSDDSAAVPPAHEGLAPAEGTLTPPPAKTNL